MQPQRWLPEAGSLSGKKPFLRQCGNPDDTVRLSAAELDPLLGVAVATLDRNGVLLAANAGFRRLLGNDPTRTTGARIGRCFIQPSFASLVQPPPHQANETYHGLMTIGEFDGVTRTLLGRVWQTAEGLRVVAEFDVEELERISDALLDLNRDSMLSQRTLGVENEALKLREEAMVETSLTDALTGVGNRRKLDQAMAIEIARAVRTGQPLSVLMTDLDHFKQINDRHGHAIGDKVLAHFGALLRLQTRPTDVAARFGGEEFVVLMPHTNIEHAKAVAERIRITLAQEHLEPMTEPVTSSFGVAELTADETAESLLRRVDAALYQAKHTGRNKVVESQR